MDHIIVIEETQNVIATLPNNVVVTESEIKIIQGAEPNIVQVVDSRNVVYAPILESSIIAVASQGPPGTSGGALVTEVPTGDLGGLVFNLSHSAQTIILYLNGLALSQPNDFSVSDTVITFVSEARPQVDDNLLALYSY